MKDADFVFYSCYIPWILYEKTQVTMQTRLRVLQILLILCIFQKGKFSNHTHKENN